MKKMDKASVSIRTLLGAALASAMLVGSLALTGCGGTSSGESADAAAETEVAPEEVAEEFAQALFDGDGETVWNLIFPEMRDATLEQEDMTEEEAIDELSNIVKSNLGSVEDYIDSIEVTEQGSTDLNEDEIADLVEAYDSDYDIQINVSAAKEVDLEVKLVLNSDGEDLFGDNLSDDDLTTDVSLVVVQIDGQWYVDPTGMSM